MVRIINNQELPDLVSIVQVVNTKNEEILLEKQNVLNEVITK